MNKELTAKLETIKAFEKDDLINNTNLQNGNEKKAMTLNIAHLAEIRKRKLHIDLGYSSLYKYCTEALIIPEGSAYHRIQVAGVCERFPETLTYLYEGRTTLTNAGILSPHLTAENHLDLLERSAGKTRKEVEEIVAAIAPKSPLSSGIRQRCEPLLMTPQGSLQDEPEAKSLSPKDESDPEQTSPSLKPSTMRPATPETYNFRFSADKTFMDTLNRLAEVHGIHGVSTNLAILFEKAMEDSLDRRDPMRRKARRDKRAKAAAEKAAKEGVRCSDAPTPVKGDTGHGLDGVPASMMHDGGHCSGSDPATVKCSSVMGDHLEKSRYIPPGKRDDELARSGCQCRVRGSGRKKV